MAKWFQDEPQRPKIGERLLAGLAQTGHDCAFIVEALPELVPGEMHGDAVVFVERFARWAEEHAAWRKRQPYTQEWGRYAFRLFDSDPIISGSDLDRNWFSLYRARVAEGAEESVLRAAAASFVEALRLRERAAAILDTSLAAMDAARAADADERDDS